MNTSSPILPNCYFSAWCDKIPNKATLRRAYFGSQLKGTVYHGGEGQAARARGSCNTVCIFFLSFIQSRTPTWNSDTHIWESSHLSQTSDTLQGIRFWGDSKSHQASFQDASSNWQSSQIFPHPYSQHLAFLSLTWPQNWLVGFRS